MMSFKRVVVMLTVFSPALLWGQAVERQAEIDALTKQLRLGNYQVASKGLVAIGEPAVDSLIPFLAQDGSQTIDALRVLADIGPAAHRAVPALIEVLQGNEKELGVEFRQVDGYATPYMTSGNYPLPSAGLQGGQFLIAVNDTSVVGMPLPKIYELLREQKGKFTVTVRDEVDRWFKGPVQKGQFVHRSILYSPLRVLNIDLDRPRFDPVKEQAIKTLARLGEPARVALPELEKIVALEESLAEGNARGAVALVRGPALDAISVLFPASREDIPKLSLDLKHRDKAKADLAWAKLSYLPDLPPETLFAMRERIKRVTIVRRGEWFPLPGNFPESLARIACNHRSWADELTNDPDPDIASAMAKTFRRVKFPEACAFPYIPQ